MRKASVSPYLGQSVIGDEEGANLLHVVSRKAFFRHTESCSFCEKMETLLSEMFEVPYARILSNCTSALKCSLISLGLVPGELVAIPAITFIATANAVLSGGFIPLLVDCDNKGHMDSGSLMELLRLNKVKACIVAHLDGSSANVSSIMEVCDRWGIPLIEDCAQSLAVKRDDRYVGTFGTFGCFSFQENKLLTSGEGGALVSSRNEPFQRAISYADHGSQRQPDGIPVWTENGIGFGENFKITELQAAVLDAQLSKLPQLIEILWDHYRRLTDMLPEGSFRLRETGDIPISIWLHDTKTIKLLEESAAPLYSFEYMDLQRHPIIKNRISSYPNGFPWSLRMIRQPSCKAASDFVREHRMILVPVSTQKFQALMNTVKEALGV